MKTSPNKTKLAAFAAAPLLAVAVALAAGVFTHQATAASNPNVFAVGGFTAMDLSHVAFAAQQNPQNPRLWFGHVVQEDATGAS